jgi:hypothetical protein
LDEESPASAASNDGTAAAPSAANSLSNEEARENNRKLDNVLEIIREDPSEYANNPAKVNNLLLGISIDDTEANQYATAYARSLVQEDEIKQSRGLFSRIVSTVTLNEYLWGFGEGTRRKMQSDEQTAYLESRLRQQATRGSKYERKYKSRANWHLGNANWYNRYDLLEDTSHLVTDTNGDIINTDTDRLELAHQLYQRGSRDAASNIYKRFVDQRIDYTQSGVFRPILNSHSDRTEVVESFVNMASIALEEEDLLYASFHIEEGFNLAYDWNQDERNSNAIHFARLYHNKGELEYRRGNINAAKNAYRNAITHYNTAGYSDMSNSITPFVSTLSDS